MDLDTRVCITQITDRYACMYLHCRIPSNWPAFLEDVNHFEGTIRAPTPIAHKNLGVRKTFSDIKTSEIKMKTNIKFMNK